MLQHIGCFIHKCAILKYMLQHIGRSTPPNFIFCLPLWKNVIYFPNLNSPPPIFPKFGEYKFRAFCNITDAAEKPNVDSCRFSAQSEDNARIRKNCRNRHQGDEHARHQNINVHLFKLVKKGPIIF